MPRNRSNPSVYFRAPVRRRVRVVAWRPVSRWDPGEGAAVGIAIPDNFPTFAARELRLIHLAPSFVPLFWRCAMIPTTTERVPRHTAEEINEKIRSETETNVRHLATLGDSAIRQRLNELDREWDIERALEANAATVTLIGVILGVAKSRKWFVLPC